MEPGRQPLLAAQPREKVGTWQTALAGCPTKGKSWNLAGSPCSLHNPGKKLKPGRQPLLASDSVEPHYFEVSWDMKNSAKYIAASLQWQNVATVGTNTDACLMGSRELSLVRGIHISATKLQAETAPQYSTPQSEKKLRLLTVWPCITAHQARTTTCSGCSW